MLQPICGWIQDGDLLVAELRMATKIVDEFNIVTELAIEFKMAA